jgi:hypothetical protein
VTSEAQAVHAAMPSDNELRIGTVATISPLTVNFQGQPVACGKLASYVPVIGDTVAVLRQDATWLVLGSSSQIVGKQLSQSLYVQASALLGLTAAVTDVPGVTVTFNVSSPAAWAAIQWTGDFESLAATATVGVASLWLDGAAITGSPQALFGNGGISGARATAGNQYMTTLGTGSRTLTLRGNRAGGADGVLRLNAQHTTMLVQVYE